MVLQHRTLITALCIVTVSSSWAQTLKVTRFVDNGRGGVEIQAEYDQGKDPWCKDENVRWIQRLLLKQGDGKTEKTDVPGYPKASFIDPQPTQGGSTFDNLPWYDFTYGSAADRAANQNKLNGGGKFFNDTPAGWGPFGPMYFCAWTAVVCTDTATKKASFMGGFTWGFCVSATGAISLISTTTLGNNDDTVGIFNTALGSGPDSFKDWSLTKGDDKCQLTVTSVPEPTSLVALACAGLLVLRRRRTN